MGVLRCTINQTWLGQQIRNTIHYGGGDAILANGVQIADAIRDAYVNSGVLDRLSTSWSVRSVSMQDVQGNPGVTVEFPFTGGDLTGNSQNESITTQVAAIIRWLAYTARPNRGRIYQAGLQEGSMANSRIRSGTVNDLLNFGQELLDLPANTGLAMALVIARYNAGVYVGSNIVEAVQVPDVPGVIRRRRLGSGI